MKSKWTIAAAILLAASLGLTGCEGDDGKDGAPGVGTDGDDGISCWDLNGNGIADPEEDTNGDGVVDALDCQGPGVVTLPLETCAVCHGEGAFASAPASHEVFDQGAFADFAVAEVGADLEITFSATVDGAPPVGATLYRAYVGDGTQRTTLRSPPRGTDPGTDLVVFTDNGGGNYTVTVPDGVALVGGTSTNQRYLMILRVGDNQLEVAAYGDYPNPLPLAGLASNQACQDCHGESGEVGRFAPDNGGGHYSAPMSADACIVCHMTDDPATVDDEEPSYMRLARVAHGIHNSHNFPDGEFVTDRGNAYNITYPTYMTNCSVCHSGDNVVPAAGVSALAAANAMPVTADGCFSCHGTTATMFPPTDPPNPFAGLHANIVSGCETCHVANGPGAAVLTVADAHNGIVTERGGIIFDGVDTSVVEGAKFVWEITGIVDDGVNLAISWQASYDGVAVNPCNATVGPTAPLFHGDGSGNLSMLRSYFQGDDPILGQSTSAPGQANAVNVTVDNTTCTGNVATTNIAVDDVDVERGIVALQGKPRVISVLDPAAVMAVRAKTPTYEWMVGSGDAPLMARREIVDTEVCLQCHVGSLYQHGGNRVDNVDMCVLCHNSASNEQSVRVDLGVDPSEAYDGKVGETFEMKTMLHRVHSSGTEGQPLYVIYRGRGIYAWAPDESLLPDTWPGTGPQIVFGSEGDAVINHNFHAPTYPRALNACAACHTADFAVIPDQTEAMATTVAAGSTEWINQLDDTLQGAATTACITCHTSGPAKGHAYQNSWVPQVFPEGRETIIDAVK